MFTADVEAHVYRPWKGFDSRFNVQSIGIYNYLQSRPLARSGTTFGARKRLTQASRYGKKLQTKEIG